MVMDTNSSDHRKTLTGLTTVARSDDGSDLIRDLNPLAWLAIALQTALYAFLDLVPSGLR